MKNIFWLRPDGGISVSGVPEGIESSDWAAELKSRTGDGYEDWQIVGLDLPQSEWPDEYWFDGWTHDGTKVTVDNNKARELTKKRLRRDRVPLFEQNDLVLRDAIAEGDNVKRTAALAERDRLRDITKLADRPDITLDELKALRAEST